MHLFHFQRDQEVVSVSTIIFILFFPSNLEFSIKLSFQFLFTGRKYAMLKLKILLSTIMRNYRIFSDLKEDDFKLQADIILKREEGFQVRLERRKQTTKA